MTNADVGRLFEKLDDVNEKVSVLNVSMARMESGQEAFVKELTRVGDLAKQTNDMTILCPARNELPSLMRRLDGVERGKVSIAPGGGNGMQSAAKRSLQLLQILGPWIVIIVGSVYAVSQPKAATEDQVKKAEAAAVQIQQVLPQIQAALRAEEQEHVLPGFWHGEKRAAASSAPAEEAAAPDAVPDDERLPL